MQLRRLFSETEVQELHVEILRIVDELNPPDDLRVEVYRSVCNMAGQVEAPSRPTVGIPIGPNGLPI